MSKKDAIKIVEILKNHYPDAKCSLDFKTPFEMLVAVCLSAQCTDDRVNKTTQIPYGCDRMNCGECLFNKAGYTCGQCRWKWLGAEYKEPIKLSTSEKAFLNEIESAYDLLRKEILFYKRIIGVKK